MIMKKKTKLVEKIDKYANLKNDVLLNTNNIWLPINSNINLIDSNSWFDIEEYVSPIKNNKIINANITTDPSIEITRCEKIKMYPTPFQKILLIHWMDCYISMYNEVTKLYKTARYNNQSITVNWKNLRTNYLKDIKQKIILNSQLKECVVNTKVNAHVL